MTDPILVTREGRLQTIRFNRVEKKNAITRTMYQTMADALIAADDDDDIGAILFLGQPEVFTSGNDLQDFLLVATGQEPHGGEVLAFLRAIIAGKKPLVAGVDGLAIGVGCTMLMHCDLVHTSARAVLQTPFVDLGLVPEAASSLVAPTIMGYQNAFALLGMGKKFSAERARDVGLVNDVFSPDDLEARATEAATELANKPPEAMAISRRLIRGDREPILKRMEEEGAQFVERLKSDEARNAFVAFMNKSKAS